MALFVTGDIHGEASHIAMRVLSMEERLTPQDTLLCLGDVGIKYGSWRQPTLLDYLVSLPCTVLVLRGNHDTRYCRDMLLGTYGERPQLVDWGGGVCLRDEVDPNVLYLPDGGGAYAIEGHRCLMVPGAWSIDWKVRFDHHLPFEEEEQLTATERRRLGELARSGDVEYVFSHTCPYSWMGTMSDLLLPVGTMRTDNTMERWMDEVLGDVAKTCEGWYFGHFHDDRQVSDIGHLLLTDIIKVF